MEEPIIKLFLIFFTQSIETYLVLHIRVHNVYVSFTLFQAIDHRSLVLGDPCFESHVFLFYVIDQAQICDSRPSELRCYQIS